MPHVFARYVILCPHQQGVNRLFVAPVDVMQAPSGQEAEIPHAIPFRNCGERNCTFYTYRMDGGTHKGLPKLSICRARWKE